MSVGVNPSPPMPPRTSAPVVGSRGLDQWSDEWAQKFRDIGVAEPMIHAIHQTGGLPAAELQKQYDTLKADHDKAMAKFAADMPEQLAKMRSRAGIKQSQIAAIANQYANGTMTRASAEMEALRVNQTWGQWLVERGPADLLAFGVVPQYMGVRLLAAPFTGGRDPIFGDLVVGDPMTNSMSALYAFCTAFTVHAVARTTIDGNKARSLAAAGGVHADLAKRAGVADLKGLAKLGSYMPWTQSHAALAGIGRFDDDLLNGVQHLTGIQKELAANAIEKITDGRAQIFGKRTLQLDKVPMPGLWGNYRNAFPGNWNKPLAQMRPGELIPTIELDVRARGKALPAYLASIGVELADGDLKQRAMAVSVAPNLSADAHMKAVKQHVFGMASKDLMDSANPVVTRQSPFFAKTIGRLTARAEMARAITQLDSGALAGAVAKSWYKGPVGIAVAGVAALGAAGLGYVALSGSKTPAQPEGGAAAGSVVEAVISGKTYRMPKAVFDQVNAFFQQPVEQQKRKLVDQERALTQWQGRTDLTQEQQVQVANLVAEFEIYAARFRELHAPKQPAGATAATAPTAPAGGAPRT